MEIQRKQMKCNCGLPLLPVYGARNDVLLGCTACNVAVLNSDELKFQPERIAMTDAAFRTLSPMEVMRGLSRHVSGDWGELSDGDRRRNDLALAQGFRLLSRYVATDGTVFWIVTEHDRSVTTILLPADY